MAMAICNLYEYLELLLPLVLDTTTAFVIAVTCYILVTITGSLQLTERFLHGHMDK